VANKKEGNTIDGRKMNSYSKYYFSSVFLDRSHTVRVGGICVKARGTRGVVGERDVGIARTYVFHSFHTSAQISKLIRIQSLKYSSDKFSSVGA